MTLFEVPMSTIVLRVNVRSFVKCVVLHIDARSFVLHLSLEVSESIGIFFPFASACSLL